jgi:cysteine sulfinate desulfinase/cysteine desulfurase-like protein
MTAMNLPPEVIDGSFRVSLSRETTAQELQKLVRVLTEEVVPRAR